jgi:Mrp family chromosome partitioning ATPase/DUF971 family protein
LHLWHLANDKPSKQDNPNYPFSFDPKNMQPWTFLVLIFEFSVAFVPTQPWGRPISQLHSTPEQAIPTEWRGQVLEKLKNIIDPDLGSDIVTLGFIQNLKREGNSVAFDVELTTPACPVKDQFAADCEKFVRQIDWVESVTVTMTAQSISDDRIMSTALAGLSQVSSIIAVSSCKGGVGKSTTAVNLAYALQSLGGSVGILDVDVYGPSLPTMVTPDDDIVRFVGRQIAPLQRNGVRLMSFGYINDGSAVMRGPMVNQLLDQLLSVVSWGKLDYLILDMPPGTGDIQLSLTQRLNLTAAVIVTTPQELSFADVVRGIEMFDSVNVPSIAVVENMAYYESQPDSNIDTNKLTSAILDTLQQSSIIVESNRRMKELAKQLVDVVMQQQQSSKIEIFGSGHKKRLAEQFGIEHTFSIPLLSSIAKNGDSGTPFILEHPDSPQASVFKDLAKAVVSEVAKVKFNTVRPQIKYNADAHVLEVQEHKEHHKLLPADLRRECRCASCVEELTGRQILVKSSIPDKVKPLKLYPTGNYALSVDWSDGHRSLYPYRQIRSLLKEKKTPDNQNKVMTSSERSVVYNRSY